ncbi:MULTISPECIES: ectoine/hydroxyectoine ABC transporter substrate-binding protein EhuB [Oceanobacillus]|uniref:ectoine/hydroxyectoine ABC transporter substrate-binding protein EhuB n=1 Tax=Oceanobacillus TaxID=182709 RepID=UPI00034BB2CB|nr:MULTISPECIES: ectoine/hydroxyectoine ABC transporter substrate-binding protein EhuB [Oceanobacillus]MBT2652848.1 ectoine/hydroxyectoine ABC transporter substrate-binding protein EhuB [Oceanobacillus sp. ISL-73]MCT1577392.1 ectoine/hydroxyectoine ABC transporter substrate-binding protein EhuB [Oceanobacillus kimchii]MCT2136998.1 ectoine/hydroxyectoine ABC transporter substrate-binding protein EhuB [Oceanobacillus kimchii]OEH53594.1 ectoine/hydroxyectoine ABC transporter substrate-binding prot
MKKKLITVVILSAILVFFLAACGSDSGSLEDLQDEGTVEVGFANESPYAYENDNGELSGASVDIAKAVFAELGIDNVEGKLSEWGELIPGVQAGQFDVITAGMAIQPARCENALFSEPTMQYGEGLVVAAGNPHGLESYQDIADNPDVTVIVMEGATEIGYLEEVGVNPDQITTAGDIPATFSAVQSGRADATTGTEMTVRENFASANTEDLELVETFEQPDIPGVPSYGGAAFHPDNEELRDAYNEKLKELKEDGTVAELLEKNGFHPENNFVEDGSVTTEQLCNGEV